PLKNAKIVYKRWDHYWQNKTYHWAIDVSKYTADEQGRLRVPTGGTRQWDGYLMFAEADGRYAFVQEGFSWWQQRGRNGNTASDTRMYSMTDRPVYRPGDSVHGKIILRQRNGGEWENVKGRGFRLQMYNAKGEEKFNKKIQATSFGAIEYDIDLAKDASLGGWYFYLYSAQGSWIGSGNFQVEEYKKPEFEVSVSPPSKPVKLGNAISATIDAKYYFGGPASGATVKYKVYRNFYYHSVYFPRRYDWLYNWKPRQWYGTPDQQFNRHGGSELVTEGEGKLNQEGKLVIEWNTQKALKDWGEYDHQYSITAEVTDSSRRTIVGNGSVKALRRAFFAFVDNKLGFYRPNDELDVEVRTVTADDKAVEAKGKMEVYKVTFSKRTDENGMPQIDEHKELIATHELNTNKEGRAQYNKPFTEAGTYELVYVTKDEWDTEIKGYTRVIVKATKWLPGSYRFDTISLIPQQKVYTPGEVAKVLLASDFETSWMLVSVMGCNEVLSQSFVNLKDTGGQFELELTVGREHLPNFHINVMTVRNGQLHTKTVELFVPPTDQFLDVEVTSDKEWYQPGEKATFTVTAKDSEGRPAVAEFAMSVYDRSITYIMSDRTPNIIKHFYGDRRYYTLDYSNSYQTSVGSKQWDKQKYENIRYYGRPLGWGIRNWLRWERNAFDFNDDVSKSDRYQRGWSSDKEGVENRTEEGKPKSSSVGLGGGAGGGGGLRRKSKGANEPDMEMEDEVEFEKDEPPSEGEDLAPNQANSDSDNESPHPSAVTISLKETAKSANAATPRIRSNFKDSVYYNHRVVTGPDGKATITVEMPDNLTDWQISARGITRVAKVGEDKHTVKTTKKLILRDQAPRFFVEGDIVTLSGIIMNRYDVQMSVNARLQLNPTDTATAAEKNAFCTYQLFPETPGAQTVTVPANGEVRVDWQVKMTGSGLFQIRMLALSELESDATIKSYKCKVRGAEMYQAVTSVIEDGQSEASFEVNLPEALDPNQTHLDLQLSPSVAALAMDAIPYLLQFPYGCVEQTMSRFLPAVVVRKTLEDAGISLEDIGKRRAAMDYDGVNPQAAYWYKRSPVFNSDVMNNIINSGIKRLSLFQHGDGGWGWWRGGRSDNYMSAYVVFGLHTAKQAGVKFDYNMLTRGVKFLGDQARKEKNLHRAAYISYVLSYSGSPDKELLDKVYDRRDDLTHLSRSMICMAEWLAGDKERARILISNIEDYRQEDIEHGTVWWDGGAQYWSWWNNKIETNAFVMQAMVMVQPDSQYLEKHVRWLAQSRKGSRWNSTKDTSHAVSALMAYAKATGELEREYDVIIKMDGQTIKTWSVTKKNIFALQTNFRMDGLQLPAGKHKFTIERIGEGKVYFSSFLSYFSKEEKLKASGNELSIDRKYYKLVEKVEEVTITKRNPDGTTTEVKEKRLGYDRIPLAYGATLKSGDKIEVELNFEVKNDYEYLSFEDYKPAGCEPVALRSGQGYAGGLCQNVELRDDRVAFFVSYMPQGTARLKYQLRCEIPGTFSALPTQGGSMYVKEVKANSEEFKIKIVD
ncbi:MAG: MG2 domain-containing protein, partial [Planctomycetota bacterium]